MFVLHILRKAVCVDVRVRFVHWCDAFKGLPPKNLVHIQTCFVFSEQEHYQTRLYLVLGPGRTKMWSDVSICLISSWLRSWISRLTTVFHFVARLSLLRGDCHPALCQTRSWHTRTLAYTPRWLIFKKPSRSVVPVSERREASSSGRIGLDACGGQRLSRISPVDTSALVTRSTPHRRVLYTHNQGQLVLSSVRTVRLSRGVSKLQATGTQTNTQSTFTAKH